MNLRYIDIYDREWIKNGGKYRYNLNLLNLCDESLDTRSINICFEDKDKKPTNVDYIILDETTIILENDKPINIRVWCSKREYNVKNNKEDEVKREIILCPECGGSGNKGLICQAGSPKFAVKCNKCNGRGILYKTVTTTYELIEDVGFIM